jgi:hypothetical protein
MRRPLLDLRSDCGVSPLPLENASAETIAVGLRLAFAPTERRRTRRTWVRARPTDIKEPARAER